MVINIINLKTLRNETSNVTVQRRSILSETEDDPVGFNLFTLINPFNKTSRILSNIIIISVLLSRLV